MYDISKLKVGDIMVCGDAPHRQLFYIHKIDLSNNNIISCGISETESRHSCYFDKSNIWAFYRKADDSEVRLFYDLIRMKGLKFDLNKGIVRC